MTRLGELASPVVAAAGATTLLVPVGSCEQHGPHLPLDTDTRIAVAVADGVASTRGDVLVTPAVAFGASGEHQAFAGTLSIGHDALHAVLVELGRSAGHPIVFVNGHGGNRVESAAAQLRDEGRAARAWNAHVPGGDAHAGRTETSLLLAIAPDLVAADRPIGNTDPVADLLPAMRKGGVGAVSPNGVLGDATGASAAEGEALLAQLVDRLVAFLTDQSSME